MSPPLGKVLGVAPPYNYLLPLSEVNRISVLVPPVQLFFDQELIADSPTEAPTTVVLHRLSISIIFGKLCTSINP